jgi:hypothetical protein
MIATGPVDYESKEGDFTLRTISFKNVRNIDELYNQQELDDEVIVVRTTCSKVGNLKMQTTWKYVRETFEHV